jgi:valyl-tRNA synthetase
MNTTLSKNFEPGQIEERWYQHWLEKGYFNSKPDGRPPFTVVIPPPNVTGVLHMGHTLNETVQDVLVRKARMSGFNACWVPGSDHASIATEAKVVQMLEKEKGISKQNLTREEFLRYAFEWKEKYGGIIYGQIKKLGCSVDWNRTTFTMDDHYYKAVIKVFVDLYRKGLIYRGARMINWDPAAKTALSDEEVEHRDIQGKLYYVKYKVAGEEGTGDDYVVIATQRPETIMGDTAVCVNPNDERYAHLKGKSLIVPLVNRTVPVIFDEYVDPEFGTGALKVTPAHDINDYNLGLKHNLPIIDTLNEDGTLSAAAEVFVGMERFEARKKVVEQLRQDGLLLKEEDYQTRLGFSQRTNAVVEPRISTQWFLRMQQMADKALQPVINGDTKIHPEERFLNTYKHWLNNIQDWCISRQLWWGQRIPAWYDQDGNVFVAETEEEALRQSTVDGPQSTVESLNNNETGKSKENGGGPSSVDRGLRQDEDVLDTWFSSWIWPMEVFNGISEPDNEEINYYYPTSVLVTGQDIIFFWVARMIMSGMEYRNEKPFEHVYFTGMVRDKQGRKMSKSLGNSPDLLELIERFGADAVRFGILISAPAGNDLLFDDSSCEQGRNFNNKIWNALKLVKMWEERTAAVHSQQSTESSVDSGPSTVDFALGWFESRLNEVRTEVEEMYAQFRLSEALKTIYSLVWDDFCSWYLEWVKPGFDQPIEKEVYDKTVEFFTQLVQLLHPFMPFITEEIYHQLTSREDDLCVKQFPVSAKPGEAVLQQGELLKKTISAIRDARNKNGIKTKTAIRLHIQTSYDHLYSGITGILARQVNAESVNFVQDTVADSITVVVDKDRLYIQTEEALDTTAQKEQLLKDLEYLKGFLVAVEKKLGNERFVQNAKPEVVEVERRKKADAEEKIKAIEESLSGL